MHDSTAMVITIIALFFLIILIGLILFVFAAKSPGMALCLIGVFMSIAAAVQASMLGGSMSQNPGQLMITASAGSGPLLKVAVILVLSGVALIFLSRSGPVPTPADQKEVVHGA